MAKVRAVIKMQSGYSVIICDQMRIPGGSTLHTDVGDILPNQYEIGYTTECFSPNKVTALLMKTTRDYSQVKQVALL